MLVALRPQHTADDEQDQNHDGGDDLLHGNDSQRGLVEAGEWRECGEAAAVLRFDPCAQLVERDLEPAPHRPLGQLQPARDLGGGQTLEVVQQHRRPVWLGEREHLAGDELLQLDALDEVIGCRGWFDELGGPGLANPAALVRARAHPREINDHAGEPRPQRPVIGRWMLGSDDPGLLREVIGVVVAQQRAREPPDPRHLGGQLAQARVVADVIHLLVEIECRRRLDRSPALRDFGRAVPGSWRARGSRRG